MPIEELLTVTVSWGKSALLPILHRIVCNVSSLYTCQKGCPEIGRFGVKALPWHQDVFSHFFGASLRAAPNLGTKWQIPLGVLKECLCPLQHPDGMCFFWTLLWQAWLFVQPCKSAIRTAATLAPPMSGDMGCSGTMNGAHLAVHANFDYFGRFDQKFKKSVHFFASEHDDFNAAQLRDFNCMVMPLPPSALVMWRCCKIGMTPELTHSSRLHPLQEYAWPWSCNLDIGFWSFW